MAVSTTSSSSTAEPWPSAPCLRDQRIVFVGKLAGMPRREACQLVRTHGATVVTGDLATATLVVLGDNEKDLDATLASLAPEYRILAESIADGRARLVRESELWHLLGLVDDEQGVQRLYTPAMLAELLGVPVAAVRRWHRQGALVACRSVRRLPYFDFTEVAVARHLVALFQAGCSLRVIDRKLAELGRLMPESARPLADPSILVTGRRLFLRRGDDLTEPGGQLLLDFDKPSDAADQSDQKQLLKMSEGVEPHGEQVSMAGDIVAEGLSMLDQLQQEAIDWEDQGELDRAAEIYRTMLVAGGPSAETHFALADLLYRKGDLSAARERYYAAVELDEEYVEARANLGCVLAENNELELAVAAFQGALSFHADYADVHYHLANTLDRLTQHEEAQLHWQMFLALAPESPWADMARSRLGRQADSPPKIPASS